MVDIRNDFAPDEGNRSQSTPVGSEALSQRITIDPQMQELVAALLQHRQRAPAPNAEVIPLIRELRTEISEVINQVKAALSEPQLIGFQAKGHDGFSLESFADQVKESSASLEAKALNPAVEPIERQLAFMVFGVLEQFQLNWLGIDIKDLTRRDVHALLPAFLETRQVLMEIELKASLGAFSNAQQ
jgi:hypothetical protein